MVNQLTQRKISKEDLKMHMRKLWLDHIYWTRLFIVSSLGNLPDASNAAERLIRNQKEIGDLIGAFYNGQGDKITQLLTRHIMIAAEFVSSFNTVNGIGNKKTSDDIRKSWYKNADDITTYLYSLNQNWNLRDHLYKHLSLTEAQLQKRMQKDYAGEIIYADELVNQSRSIADALTDGIIRQFPMAFDGYVNANGMNGNNMNNMNGSNNMNRGNMNRNSSKNNGARTRR